MKKSLIVLTLPGLFLFLYSCTRCSRCDVTITQKAVGDTKIRTFEKCGSKKDLEAFENDIEETFKPYGNDATISCVRD